MIGLVIDGPRYELLEANVIFFANFILPPGLTPADVEITWYKNNVLVPQLPTENQFQLELWKVGFPAAGTFYAVLTVTATGETVKSNEIELEIGKVPRRIVLDVTSRRLIYVNIGETVSFRPTCKIEPTYATRTCKWYRNGEELSPDEDIDILIDDASKYGPYVLKSTGTCEGAFIPASEELIVEIKPRNAGPGQVCPLIYDNDLNAYLPYGGGRNEAYMWIGWWVWDEIREAVRLGEDWTVDITNSDYKYKCELQKVADLLAKYPEVEIQESRNGYILERKDLLYVPPVP